MGSVAPPQDLAVRQRTWGSRFRHDLSRPITITARSRGTARIAEEALAHSPYRHSSLRGLISPTGFSSRGRSGRSTQRGGWSAHPATEAGSQHSVPPVSGIAA
jgi:hypothetical protein